MSGAADESAQAGLLDGTLVDTVLQAGASAGAVYLLDASQQVLGLLVVCGIPAEMALPWHRVPVSAPVPVGEAVQRDRLVWVASQEDMARTYPRAAASLPYRFSLAAVPVPGRTHCRGALLLMWPASHPPSASRREQGYIASAARRIGRVLDEAPVPPTLPDRPRLLPVGLPRPYSEPAQAAADYAERLPEGAVALDLEGRITFLTDTAAALLGRDKDQLRGTRPWQALPWLDQPVAEDHYRTAVISRDPVAYTALRPPDVWLRFELYPDASGISARVTRAPAPETGEPPPASSPRGPAGLPADRAQAGRLYQLMHLAAALTETVAVRDVVELIGDQVLPAFGADGLVLSAAEAGRLTITGYRGYDQDSIDRLDGLPLDTDLTPAGQVLADGLPAFFTSPEEMARRHPQAPRISGKKAWAFLPLLISGRPVGCCVLSYDRPRVFSAEERAVLTSLAGLIAQALDRARLYDAKHDLAHTLQEALLPRSLPTVPGLQVAARYLPATRGIDVGGDFYDLIRLDATTAAAVIGDVQGHNVAAAALMGQVRTAIHATAGAPPDQVLARTDRVLADLKSDLLVSCLYAHIDLARGQAAVASAGHPSPLLHRPGSPAAPVPLDPAPMLGTDLGVPHSVTTVPLTGGTTLALYTDGLVEVPGRDIEHTTTDLAVPLTDHADQDLDALIDTLLHRVWPTGRHTDDIALLLLRTAPPPPPA
ncbi:MULTISPECIES: SpoIIE family protein phosphatase [unclassified Streptomyces]|uniref:SpoIIE family protein phosphatase n=1 Tax=unclassified Streptomyces TaxID=2593676 RepID=UPI003D706D5E